MRLVVVVLLLLVCCQSSRVLFLPSPFSESHAVPMKALAAHLVTRNHSVDWIEIAPKTLNIDLPEGVNRQFWRTGISSVGLAELFLHGNHSVYSSVWKAGEEGATLPLSASLASLIICDTLLTHNKPLFNKLLLKKFDTVIVDDQFNACGLLYASLSGSPFIYWSQSAMRPESAWANQSPSSPSYVPVPGSKLSDDMTSMERFYNLYLYLRAIYVHQQILQPRMDAVFQKHYPSAASAFLMERNASLNFINTPPIFDFPRPFMPRVVFVGCIHCRVPSPLPKTIAEFLNGTSSFMVASFGLPSWLDKAPQQIKETLFFAFAARSAIKFIVQYSGEEALGKNVLALPFLPLQDLLGDPRCVAHISHGGLNSVVESVWHGAPVIGIPLLFPSHDNLLRVTERGAGILLAKDSLFIHAITQAIDSIQLPRFKSEMIVFQEMIRDVPFSELYHASFWIEFIERHKEVPHARSGADHLNILQYFLLDVVLFVVSLTYLCLFTLFKSSQLIYYFIFSKKNSPGKLQNDKKIK